MSTVHMCMCTSHDRHMIAMCAIQLLEAGGHEGACCNYKSCDRMEGARRSTAQLSSSETQWEPRYAPSSASSAMRYTAMSHKHNASPAADHGLRHLVTRWPVRMVRMAPSHNQSRSADRTNIIARSTAGSLRHLWLSFGLCPFVVVSFFPYR